MAHSSRTPQPGIYEPNLTALIDVSLVLVVILLVATPMALQSGIAVSQAAAAGKKGAAAQTARIELTVRMDGQVQVNERVVPREELGVALDELMPQSPTRTCSTRRQPSKQSPSKRQGDRLANRCHKRPSGCNWFSLRQPFDSVPQEIRLQSPLPRCHSARRPRRLQSLRR